jgi:6-pyruvoyltetrahydropterin/6-carboxytetrahydropterin synthase
MIYVTRRAEFSASHYYHNPDFSAEENRRVFGKCANPHGHGHNYTLEVTVAGEIDRTTGMVMDLKELKKLLESEVLELMDHKFLNKEVPVFAAKIPTTENIAVEIWNLLQPKLRLGKLHRIRLYETPDLYVEYFGA